MQTVRAVNQQRTELEKRYFSLGAVFWGQELV